MEDLKIIAEIAQGFEGDKTQSKLLIRSAGVAGANYAKFQMVYADELATNDYKYYELFKSLEFSYEEWLELSKYSAEKNIKLIFDIFGEKSLEISESLETEMIKLHPTDISNLNLLGLVAKSKISNIILGVGGAYLCEITKAIEVLADKNVILMLGFQAYPTRDNTNQISRLLYLREYISRISPNIQLGFADHADPLKITKYSIPAAAIGAGATLLEKHLTLSKIIEMEDFESALNPDEYAEFVRVMRSTFEALGSSIKQDNFGMSEDEEKYRLNIRRHVVANKHLKAGDQILPANVNLKRSSKLESISEIDFVYGKELKTDILPNQPISYSDLK